MRVRANWNYPTSVRFGAGRISELPEALKTAGISNPLLVTDAGQLIRCPVDDVRIAGRNTQGVRIFKTDDEEKVVSVERVPEEGSSENGNGTENGNADGGNDGDV